MKNLLAIVLGLLITPGSVSAGGSLGGGTGALLLELNSTEINRDQFSALVLAGAEGRSVKLNSYQAKVKAVDFQAKRVELEVEDIEAAIILQHSTIMTD